MPCPGYNNQLFFASAAELGYCRQKSGKRPPRRLRTRTVLTCPVRLIIGLGRRLRTLPSAWRGLLLSIRVYKCCTFTRRAPPVKCRSWVDLLHTVDWESPFPRDQGRTRLAGPRFHAVLGYVHPTLSARTVLTHPVRLGKLTFLSRQLKPIIEPSRTELFYTAIRTYIIDTTCQAR